MGISCRCSAHQENQEAPDSDARFTGFQESLLDDMEQLLRSPLEEFDLAAEDSGGNSDLGAAPPSPHEQSDDDTESVEWSLQGDSEDTVSLPEVVADVLPPLLPQLRAVFASMDQVNVGAIFRQRAAVMKSVPSSTALSGTR